MINERADEIEFLALVHASKVYDIPLDGNEEFLRGTSRFAWKRFGLTCRDLFGELSKPAEWLLERLSAWLYPKEEW